jgi:hypothetical protein
MIISVINHSNGDVSDEKLEEYIRAINRKITEDFEPYWSFGGKLRLEGRSGTQPDKQNPADMRGDAIIYVWDKVDVPGALGYHDANFRGIPYGVVFTEISNQLNEDLSVTLSHEALEMLGDPEVNLLVGGPHPGQPNKAVFHWFEMCDAVQAETYEIDGVQVSNFVLPLYFTGGDEVGGRNDFLARPATGKLKSFGIKPGGYVGFCDPQTGQMDTYSLRGDAEAQRRLSVKGEAALTRRSERYKRFFAPEVADEVGSPLDTSPVAALVASAPSYGAAEDTPTKATRLPVSKIQRN